MEMMKKTYRITLAYFLIGFLLRAVLLYLFLWLLTDILRSLYMGMALYRIATLLSVPFHRLLVAAAAALLWCLCLTKAVSVSTQGVCISPLIGKKKEYPMASCHFTSFKKMGNQYIKNEKLYLQIQEGEHSVMKERLSFYSVHTYTELISSIHAASTEAVPREIRNEIVYEDMLEGEMVYRFPYEKVRRKEWKRLRLFSVIVAGCFFLALLMAYLTGDWKMYIISVLTGIMVLSIPVEVVRVMQNIKRCPRVIKKDGQFFFFDNVSFSAQRIIKIVMSDSKNASYSIYPKNRYMKIYSTEGKYRYWLGSTYSMDRGSYEALCRGLEQIFLNSADKITYSQR